MSVFECFQVDSPLVISVPHDGELVPPDLARRMTDAALKSTDRDEKINEVFSWQDWPCTKIKANYSRHVVDLNRPADGEALYQGQDETGVCPINTFQHEPIYHIGQEPDPVEINARIQTYWRPYHDQLETLIERAVAKHGWCLLIDAHSIDDEVPRFFKGRLPAINVGTNSGQSCDPGIEKVLAESLKRDYPNDHVFNGRFKGGYITRHCGRPKQGIHAIQLEHAKSSYLGDNGRLHDRGKKLRDFWQETLSQLLA